MKLSLFLLVICQSLAISLSAQSTIPTEKPDTMATVAPHQAYQSMIYLPISVNQSVLTSLIHNATPANQRIRHNSHTEDLNFDINILDTETAFNGSTITHRMRLTNGDGSYRRRGYTHIGWPCNCRVYTPWVRLDCDDIRGNASVSITTTLQPDYSLSQNSDFRVSIDNVQCAQVNVTGILRAFGWHSFKQSLTSSLNAEFRRINIKGEVAKVWTQMQMPQQLEEGVFLMVNPQQILYKDVSFRDGKLNTGVGLRFSASVGGAAEAAALAPNTPLPNLGKADEIGQNNVVLNVPVAIPYPTLEKNARKLIVGKDIKAKNKKGKQRKYAEVMDLTLAGSTEPNHEVVLGLKVKIKRSLFKRELATLYFHADLDYDQQKEMLSINDYKLDSKTESVLFNRTLELLANKVVYNQVMQKLTFDVDQALDEQKKSLNDMLSKKIEISKGISLTGAINEVEVKEILAQPQGISFLLNLTGNVDVEVLEINGLTPSAVSTARSPN